MIFGFIGAGKVGCSMGKYLTEHQIEVCGFYSKSVASAKEAAKFTNSKWYCSIPELLEECDAVFLTVPDDELTSVYKEITQAVTKSMCLIHCSGAKSSEVFDNISQYHSYGYSIHPLLAIHSKYESYQELSSSYFTIEGDPLYLDFFKEMYEGMGNSVVIMQKEKKPLYHASACMASNMIIALLEKAFIQLEDCGFQKEDARKALCSLVTENVRHVFENGVEDALTGPVERGDALTIRMHQDVMSKENVVLYNILSEELLRIAERKNKNRDYQDIKAVLSVERDD